VIQRRLLVVLALLAALVAASGSVMLVDSSEVAVVSRFGAPHRVAVSGLGLRLPWPIEADERIAVTEIRRVEVPARRMLSGDSNLLELELSVQYTVSDPVAFAIRALDPERHVAAAVMSAASSRIAGMDVDTLLTTARAAVEQGVKDDAQAEIDRLGLGVQIEAVETRQLAPPDAVVDAFNDVSSARGDKDTVVLAAESYASKRLPDVRGESAKALEEANAHASQMVAEAEGRAGRFEALRPAHARAPGATRADLVRALWAERGERVQVLVATPESRIVIEHSRGE
jgi:membrane protease subunit HflK